MRLDGVSKACWADGAVTCSNGMPCPLRKSSVMMGRSFDVGFDQYVMALPCSILTSFHARCRWSKLIPFRPRQPLLSHHHPPLSRANTYLHNTIDRPCYNMASYVIAMSDGSDDEPDEGIILPGVGEELRITKLGSNIPIPSQSDMLGVLRTFRPQTSSN